MVSLLFKLMAANSNLVSVFLLVSICAFTFRIKYICNINIYIYMYNLVLKRKRTKFLVLLTKEKGPPISVR